MICFRIKLRIQHLNKPKAYKPGVKRKLTGGLSPSKSEQPQPWTRGHQRSSSTPHTRHQQTPFIILTIWIPE